MRNNAGHGAVAIAVLIVAGIACRMLRQTNGLNGQKRGLGLVVSRRDPHLNPHEETDPFHIFISGCVGNFFYRRSQRTNKCEYHN